MAEAEFARLLDELLASGVERVRFTGGEPLLSPHLLPLVARAVRGGARDVALTTNGTRLRELAPRLREAGLRRLTLSLDTLDPVRFERLTRGGRLQTVLDGLDAARAVGFDEIKLNTVVLRGHNDDEIDSLTRFAWERGLVPRFIELMTIGAGATLPREQWISAAEIWQRLEHLVRPGEPRAEAERGPARYLRSRHDERARVGVISGHTDTYCDTCDRLRVSASGQVRSCLARTEYVDARAALNGEGSLQEVVERAWAQKPNGATFRGCAEPSAADVSMRASGG